MTHDSLLHRIAEGDEAAVVDCINRYGGLIWSIALRWSRSTADAEDSVQDIFLDLWKSAHRFQPTLASESTFVAMIARRRLIDRQRKRQLDVLGEIELDSFPSRRRNPNADLEQRDEAARAERILDNLPTEQSRAIRLSVYQGLSHSQIAKQTGHSLGTVKSNIRRGLIKVRAKLAESKVPVKGGVAG